MDTYAKRADWLRRRLVAAYWCGKMREALAPKTLPQDAPRQLTLPGIWQPPKKSDSS